MEERKGRIRPLVGPSAGRYSIEFLPDEVAVLDELLETERFESREDVVFKALSLLYTILKENSEAKVVFVERAGKRIAIPLE
jgi:hypothetical protein